MNFTFCPESKPLSCFGTCWAYMHCVKMFSLKLRWAMCSIGWAAKNIKSLNFWLLLNNGWSYERQRDLHLMYFFFCTFNESFSNCSITVSFPIHSSQYQTFSGFQMHSLVRILVIIPHGIIVHHSCLPYFLILLRNWLFSEPHWTVNIGYIFYFGFHIAIFAAQSHEIVNKSLSHPTWTNSTPSTTAFNFKTEFFVNGFP